MGKQTGKYCKKGVSLGELSKHCVKRKDMCTEMYGECEFIGGGASVAQEVKNYLREIKKGSKANPEKLDNSKQNILQMAGVLNGEVGNETGTQLVYETLGDHVDVEGFMDSLSDEQIGKIRNVITKNTGVDPGELIGGAGGYTILEIILGILFFPFSLIYFIFLR